MLREERWSLQNMDKDEAQRIADELIERERQKNPRAHRPRRVPFFLRSPDSARLEPRREWELFQQAWKNVTGNWGASIAVVSAPVILILLFFGFAPHPMSAWYVLGFDVALLVPGCLIAIHVRRELARLARAEG
jgi:hypothetical protein